MVPARLLNLDTFRHRYRSAIRRASRVLRNRLFRSQLAAERVVGGRDALILERLPRIRNAGHCSIGYGFQVRAPLVAPQLETLHDGTLTIGNHVFINEGVVIAAADHITIEDFVRFGDYSCVHDSNYHDVDAETPVKIAPVRIGKNAWIGRRAIILPGVEIGENSIVSAGAIVTKSIPKNSIAAGNPAKVLERTLSCPDGYRRA